LKGIVKRKIGERGFGFIAVEGEGDVFFHVSDCVSSFDDLGEGDAVEFELTQSKGRHRAIKVRKIG
jgi:cold shock CspA family protein